MARRILKKSRRETLVIECDRQLSQDHEQYKVLAKSNSPVRAEILREERSLEQTRAAFHRLHEISAALREIAQRAASERLKLEERLKLQRSADLLNVEFNTLIEGTDFAVHGRLHRLLAELKIYLH